MQVREMMMENTELETEVAEIKRTIERKALAKAQADIKVKLNSVANFHYIRSKTAKDADERRDAMTYVKAIKKAIDIIDIKMNSMIKE